MKNTLLLVAVLMRCAQTLNALTSHAELIASVVAGWSEDLGMPLPVFTLFRDTPRPMLNYSPPQVHRI